MSRPNARIRKGQARKVVLIFGEDPNDTTSIKALLAWLNPKLDSTATIEVRRDPPSLTRQTAPPKVRNWLSNVGRVVKIEEKKGNEVVAVLVHQDADGPDPQGARETALNRDLAVNVTGFNARAVVPVQMMEAWWLLFPDAVRAVNQIAWRGIRLKAGDVEVIGGPKKHLIQATKTASARKPYSESDSIAIAENIAKMNLGPSARSASWDRFMTMARSLY